MAGLRSVALSTRKICLTGIQDTSTAGLSFPYMMSKSAIGHATSSLAHELLPLGIRVNGIAPGLFPSNVRPPNFSRM